MKGELRSGIQIFIVFLTHFASFFSTTSTTSIKTSYKRDNNAINYSENMRHKHHLSYYHDYY